MRNIECLFSNTATWFNSSISSFYMVGMIRVHRIEFEQPPTHLTVPDALVPTKCVQTTHMFASSVFPHFSFPIFLKVQPVGSTGGLLCLPNNI